MAEILPGIHQVEGVDPSPDFSTHVWLTKDHGGTYTLIDCGLPGSEVAILAYLKKQDIAPGLVRNILLTHLHRDHVGALAKTAHLTKAKTYAHWIESAFIAMKPPYDGPGVPPAEAVTIDETFKDGDRIDAFGGLIAYHSPGHTPGHTAFYQPERKVLFSGDLFFGDGKELVLTTPDYTQHMGTAQVSARRLAALSVDSVMSYHGGPFLTDGGKRIRSLVERF